jgi:hypothetical protein
MQRLLRPPQARILEATSLEAIRTLAQGQTVVIPPR